MPTQLTYSLLPPTNVVEASVSADPDDVSRATIKIEVRNRTAATVTIDHIVFRVASGAGGDALTDNPHSITPVAVDSGRWQITAPGAPEVFRAQPIGAGTFAAAAADTDLDATRFTLYDVEVVPLEGQSLLTVEEWQTSEGPPEVVTLEIRKVYPGLRIDEFAATTYAVDAGDPVELSWATTAAEEVQILDPEGAKLMLPDEATDPAQRDGSRSVTLQTNGTYTLIATGKGATATRQVTVRVTDQLELTTRSNGPESARQFRVKIQSVPSPVPGPVPDGAVAVLSGADTIRVEGSLALSGNAQVGGSLAVSGRISGDGSVPTGVIVMWSGRVADLPTGWALCDGGDGTPDLRDRFVLGAGRGRSPGNRGGEAEVTLTEAQLPSHRHTASVDNTPILGGDATGVVARTRESIGGAVYGIAQSTQNAVRMDTNSLHHHGVTISPNGGGEPHPNMPPYYVLAFIMKL